MNTRTTLAAMLTGSLLAMGVLGGLATAEESEAMKAHNRKVLEKASQRPASETDYRNTKEYKAQSPAKQQQTDRMIERSNKAVEDIRKQKGNQ